MSEAHSRFGAGGSKSRSTRSSATLTPGTPNVVRNFRRSQAWKPERDTPSTRHISEIGWLVFSAAMNRNTVTASRSPARRRPRLFSRSRVPAQASSPSGAARAAPSAPRSSAPPAGRRRRRPGAPTSAASRSRSRDRPRSLSAAGPTCGPAQQLHAGTPAGTAYESSIPLAWRRILPARSDCADQALRCPPNRGHSTRCLLPGVRVEGVWLAAYGRPGAYRAGSNPRRSFLHDLHHGDETATTKVDDFVHGDRPPLVREWMGLLVLPRQALDGHGVLHDYGVQIDGRRDGRRRVQFGDGSRHPPARPAQASEQSSHPRNHRELLRSLGSLLWPRGE